MKHRQYRSARAAVIAVCGIMLAGAAPAHSSELLQEVVNAYGGTEAQDAIHSLEYDQAGYFLGRYQSRDTLPPYDRLPVRTFAALDFRSETGVWETISTWPGELNMGTRNIVTTDQQWTLNTISRIYQQGSMRSFASIANSTAYMMPALLVREMAREVARNPESVKRGASKMFNYIDYDTLVYNDRVTLYVHPDTRLIDVLETTEGGMWDHTLHEDASVPVRRVYRGYFEHAGVQFPRRYQQWIDGVATREVGLYDLRVNVPIDSYLSVPRDFAQVPDWDGYSGDWEISVREAGPGLYVAGGGETRILYVEFDDHFIALEAGGFPGYAEDVRRAMEPHMNGKSLRHIIPLHHHDDHAWAVHFYARNGASILTTRDKEGFLRKLLARNWGENGPVEDASFQYLQGTHQHLADPTNAFDIFVWPGAPHSENMIIGYHPASKSLFTGDFYIGWVAAQDGKVRQGATYGVRELDRWIQARQAAGEMGEVGNYIAVHGRAYSADEWAQMLATERTVTSLPHNEAWPTATWPARYGLADDTTGNPRRSGEIGGGVDPERGR